MFKKKELRNLEKSVADTKNAILVEERAIESDELKVRDNEEAIQILKTRDISTLSTSDLEMMVQDGRALLDLLRRNSMG